jgi:hypothetical protein
MTNCSSLSGRPFVTRSQNSKQFGEVIYGPVTWWYRQSSWNNLQNDILDMIVESRSGYCSIGEDIHEISLLAGGVICECSPDRVTSPLRLPRPSQISILVVTWKASIWKQQKIEGFHWQSKWRQTIQDEVQIGNPTASRQLLSISLMDVLHWLSQIMKTNFHFHF